MSNSERGAPADAPVITTLDEHENHYPLNAHSRDDFQESPEPEVSAMISLPEGGRFTQHLRAALARALPAQTTAQSHLPAAQHEFVFAVDLSDGWSRLCVKLDNTKLTLTLVQDAKIRASNIPMLRSIMYPDTSDCVRDFFYADEAEFPAFCAGWESRDLYEFVYVRLHGEALFSVAVFPNELRFVLTEGVIVWDEDPPFRYENPDVPS